MYTGLRVKHPILLSDFNKTLKFIDRFSRSPQIPNFMKIRPVRAELFRADRRTDTTKLIVAVRNSGNAPTALVAITLPSTALRYVTFSSCIAGCHDFHN